MSIRWFYLALLLPAMLTGCATNSVSVNDIRNRSMLIDPAMSKTQVLRIMGAPVQRSFQGSGEALTFCGITPFGGSLFYNVWLNNGSVVGVTNYTKRDDIGDCDQYASVINWGQIPPDIRVRIEF